MWIFLVVAIILFSNANAQDIFSGEMSAIGNEAIHYELLKKRVDLWRGAPLYQRIAAAQEAASYLTDLKRIRETGNFRGRSEHDLEIVAGRAALVITGLIGLTLPSITRESTQDEVKAFPGIAAAYCDGLIRGLVETRQMFGAVLSSEVKKRVLELKEGYNAARHKDASEDELIKAVDSALGFLALQNPIGCTKEEIEAFFGPLSAIDKDNYKVNVLTRLGGISLCFTIKGDVVTKVLLQSSGK
ncbi:MAG TPA: hypothetical protein VEK08_24030 [Planctomycetota bacterium]|nr:hypothetical protein [Planctomycetota bacterium]